VGARGKFTPCKKENCHWFSLKITHKSTDQGQKTFKNGKKMSLVAPSLFPSLSTSYFYVIGTEVVNLGLINIKG